MKRLLITGHRGLLGSACVRHFERKYTVFTSLCADLTDRFQAHQVVHGCKPDVLIHCAARVGGVKANRDFPVDFMLKNGRMQENIMEAAAESGVEKFIFCATSCLFPSDAPLPVTEESLMTGRMDTSVEAYSIAKLYGWRMAKAYCQQYGKKFLTIAPSNIFGIQDNYSDEAHVIPALIRKMHEACTEKRSMEVWGDGSAIREFIFSDDVASAIDFIIEKWDSPEVINVGTGLSTSIKDLVGLIARTSPYGTAPKIKWNTDAPTGIPRKTFDVTKLKALGWTPKYDLESGLRITWNDFLNSRPRGMRNSGR